MPDPETAMIQAYATLQQRERRLRYALRNDSICGEPIGKAIEESLRDLESLHRELMSAIDRWHFFFMREPKLTMPVADSYSHLAAEMVDFADTFDKTVSDLESTRLRQQRQITDSMHELFLIEEATLAAYKNRRLELFAQFCSSKHQKAVAMLAEECALEEAFKGMVQRNLDMAAGMTEPNSTIARHLCEQQAQKLQPFVNVQSDIACIMRSTLESS